MVEIPAAFLVFYHPLAKRGPRYPDEKLAHWHCFQIGGTPKFIDGGYLKSPVLPDCSDVIANSRLANIIWQYGQSTPSDRGPFFS